MATTLISNPFAESFSSALVAPWAVVAPGSSSISINSGKLRISFASGGSYTWDNSGANAPRASLQLFTPNNLMSMNDFVVQFKVVTATVTGVAGKPAAGGLAMFKSSSPQDVVPIIEFGSDNTLLNGYHSWDGLIGNVLATTNNVTLPLWVRIVRSDNVVYPLISITSASGPWMSLSPLASTGRLFRSTADSTPTTYYDSIALYARTSAAGASGLVFEVDDFSVECWGYQAAAVAVDGLRARTNQNGSAINLSWTNPTGDNKPRYMSIWRSRYGHPEYKRPIFMGTPPEGAGLSAAGEEVYSGAPIEAFDDMDLSPDRFYYYTVFATRAPAPFLFLGETTILKYDVYPCDTDWGPQASSYNKVTGWAQKNYVGEEPGRLYNKLPEEAVELDQMDKEAARAASGYLERFADFLQHAEGHHRGLIAGFGYINDPSQAPLGLVGAAADQTSIVDAYLAERNVTSLARLDGVTRRRLWEGIIAVYKQKGSIPGVSALVTLLTGWRSATLQEPGLGVGLRGFKTWDGSTTKEEFTIAGGLTFGLGTISGFVGLLPSKYKGGVYLDFFGNKKIIADNTDTALTLVDSLWTGYNSVAITGTVSGGGSAVQITAGWPTAYGPNDYSYNGAVLAGTKTGALATPAVAGTTYSGGGSSFAVEAGSFMDGAGQSFKLGYAFTGGTFGTLSPTAKCWLYVGEPSWLYNAKSDLSLAGTSDDPFYRMWLGTDYTGIGAKIPNGPTDLVVWAPPGAAKFAALTASSFEDSTVHKVCIQYGPSRPDVQVGDWINPNRAQGQWFRISQIEDSLAMKKYRVDPSPDGLVPSDVAKPGDVAVIATRATKENDGVLRFFLPLVLPYDTALFVLYTDPTATTSTLIDGVPWAPIEGTQMNKNTVNQASYNVSTSDYYLEVVWSTSDVSLVLPAGGNVCVIKGGAYGSTHNIVITATGVDKVDGGSSITISAAGDSVTLVYDPLTTNWASV